MASDLGYDAHAECSELFVAEVRYFFAYDDQEVLVGSVHKRTEVSSCFIRARASMQRKGRAKFSHAITHWPDCIWKQHGRHDWFLWWWRPKGVKKDRINRFHLRWIILAEQSSVTKWTNNEIASSLSQKLMRTSDSDGVESDKSYVAY